MQTDTGCKINVSPATGQDIERDIGLVGSRDSSSKSTPQKSNPPLLTLQQQEKNNRTGGGGGGRRGDDRQFNGPSYPNNQTSNQRPYGGQQGVPAAEDKADPYAAYGGYEAYAMLWYNYQQQAQQNSQAQGSSGS